VLAAVLHVERPSIAKIAKKNDMYLSTLRRHIVAIPDELGVIAR